MSCLADIVGEEALQSLMAWRGGRQIAVPMTEEGLGSISAVIGERAALRLFDEAAGREFSIPRGKHSRWLSTVRIKRMSDQGMTAPQIAGELGCTVRAVRKRLARAKALE